MQADQQPQNAVPQAAVPKAAPAKAAAAAGPVAPGPVPAAPNPIGRGQQVIDGAGRGRGYGRGQRRHEGRRGPDRQGVGRGFHDPAPRGAPPAPRGPVILAAEAADPPVIVLHSLRAFLESRVWRISPKQQALFQAAIAFGVPAKEEANASIDDNRHALSAAVRRHLLNVAVQTLAERGKRVILCPFGSPRDAALDRKIAQRVLPAERVRLIVERPIMVGQDLARHVPPQAPAGPPDAAILTDLYQFDQMALSPAAINAVIQRVHGPVVWIGHRFRGVVGTIFDEGAWKRTEAGIVSYADTESDAYGPHPDSDWIFEKSSTVLPDGPLSWAIVKNIGSMHVVLFAPIHTLDVRKIHAPSPYRMIDLGIPVTPDNFATRALLDAAMKVCPRLITAVCTTETIVVHHATYQSLLGTLGARDAGPAVLRQTQVRVRQALTQPWSAVNRHFPDMFENYTFKMALSLVLDNAISSGRALRYANDVHGLDLSQHNAEVRRFGASLTPSASWLFAAGSCLLALCLARLFPSQLHWFKLAWLRSRRTAFFGSVIGAGLAWFALRATGPGAIIPEHPVWSALAEEGLADFVHPALPGALDVLMTTRRSGLWEGAKTAIFHTTLSFIPTPWRALAHVAVNAMSDQQLRYCPWSWFRQEAHENPSPFLLSEIAASRFSPAEMPTTRVNANCAVPAPDPMLELDRPFPFLDPSDIPSDQQIFWMLPTNAPMWAPAATDWNKMITVQARLLKPPPLDPAMQQAAWDHAEQYIRAFCPLFFQGDPASPGHELIWDDLVQPWFDHFEAKLQRDRYRAAIKNHRNVDLEAVIEKGVETMVKTDEVLARRAYEEFKFRDEIHETLVVPEMKPRLIAVVSPDIQVAVGPYLYGAAQRMKQYWWLPTQIPWKIHSEKIQMNKALVTWRSLCFPMDQFPTHISVSYGSGRSDVDLSEWFSCAMIPPYSGVRAVHIIVAGDDSLVIIHDPHPDHPTVFAVEADASMFDQSQSIGPLGFEYHVLHDVGVPWQATKILRDVAFSPYLVDFKCGERVRISRANRPMRDTGGPDTTVGNTVVMMGAWVYAVLQKVFETQTFESTFKSLGLDMKLKYLDDPADATFLKGFWRPSIHLSQNSTGWIWGPLPSRILKFGKSWRDPRQLYPEAKMDPVQAARRFLGDQAEGLAQFNLDPLLEALVKTYRVPGAVPPPPSVHKTTASKLLGGVTIDQRWVIDWICTRYQCTPEDVHEVMQLIASTDGRPFVFLEHPLFEQMVARDYA